MAQPLRPLKSINRGQRLLAFRVDGTSTGLKEITDVECVADVSSSLNDTLFVLWSAGDAQEYHVAIDVDGAGTYTPPVGVVLVPVAISENDTADDVAAAVQAAIDALDDFEASVVTDTVTITNAAKGATTDAEDDGDAPTGFTITVTQQGTDSSISIAEGKNDAVLSEDPDSPGIYTLTFAEKFARVPSVVPAPLTADRNLIVSTVSTSAVTISSVSASGQAPADAEFHVLVSGPMI